MLTKLWAVRGSWVMLDGAHHFVPLPREKTLFTSPPRTSLALDAGNAYPGKEPLAVNCSSGTAHLTNQRVSSTFFQTHSNRADKHGDCSSSTSQQNQQPSSSLSPPRSSIFKTPTSPPHSSVRTCGMAYFNPSQEGASPRTTPM